MNECATCPRERRVKAERPYRSVPRQIKSSAPRRRFRSQCDSSYAEKEPWDLYQPYFESTYSPGNICLPPCPCPSPCQETRCSYCPASGDYGFLSSIRNGFQRIFNGNRKRSCAPICKGRLYNYSASQLKAMEQYLCKLEDEANCIDNTIKEAFNCDYPQNYGNLRCSLAIISDRLETVKGDLSCASDCYDPCRDQFEFNLICTLLERSNCLAGVLNDACLQLECLEYQFSKRCCYRSPCEPGCRKLCCVQQSYCKPNCMTPCCNGPVPYAVPCDNYVYNCRPCRYSDDIGCGNNNPVCRKQRCETNCQKPCCVKRPSVCERPRRNTKKNNLYRTSSVIPLGVMLVKL